MMKKTILAAVAALALAACGDAGEQAAELRAQAGAAVDQHGVAQAVVSAVDVEAAKGLVEGAARDALREALPTGEIAAAAAIIDEEALVDGLGKAIDGHAVGQAVKGAVDDARGQPVPVPAE
jgi:hypothetical protein